MICVEDASHRRFDAGAQRARRGTRQIFAILIRRITSNLNRAFKWLPTRDSRWCPNAQRVVGEVEGFEQLSRREQLEDTRQASNESLALRP